MMNEEEVRRIVTDELSRWSSKMIHPSQLVANVIKQRHVDGMIIKRGLIADRPADGGAVGILAYFSTDDSTLAIWNGSAWVSEVFS
jgi:hypothetical protein